VDAYVWFSLSAAHGDEISKESRDRASEALSIEDQKLARELLRVRSGEIAARRRQAVQEGKAAA